MKYEVGDRIIVTLTNEEGKVVDIMNEQMVMIEVKGVKFPAYLDQIDFPYFKMFTEQRQQAKKKVYIDNVQREGAKPKEQTGQGVSLSFMPIYSKDIFDDEVVEKFKLHLVNENRETYQFKYDLIVGGESIFNLHNTLHPQQEFYLHDVDFEDLSDNPRFDFEFSLPDPGKKKAPYFETGLKLKGKQLFKKIEELQIKNEPRFAYALFESYPDKVEEEKVDLSKLGNAGFRMYDASKAREHLPPARTVVDLHIEKLSDHWEDLGNFEILTLQLKEFEKYYDLAVAHKQRELTIIHGVGTGKLRDELHEILRLKKEVKSFVNQYHHAYGYGATEIYFN